MIRKRWILVLLLTLFAMPVFARSRHNVTSCQGGLTNYALNTRLGSVVVKPSVAQCYPLATVNVYLTGTTTPISLFKANGTALGNPITTDRNGDGFYYADDGTYDEKYSGGGITIAFTKAGIQILSSNTAEFNVKTCGAKGDGATNDTFAVQACVALLIANGGGRLVFPASTGKYIVGIQDFAGANLLGYAYRLEPIVTITTPMSIPIEIIGEGAVLRLPSGLKYGGYDPVTGLSSADVTGNVNKAASLGAFIKITNQTQPVYIRGFELDGNNSNQTIGGLWSSDGRQLDADGIMLADNQAQVTIENVYTHNNCLDGIIVHQGSAVPFYKENSPTVLINLRSEANCRQGLSWTGGSGLTAINCKFNFTGITTGGLGFTPVPFASPPGAGVDIEPAIGGLRNGMFINCEFIHNNGPGLVSDAGPDAANVTFLRCRFAGYVNYSIWIKQPFFIVRDSDIIGSTIWGYAPTTAGVGGATVWENDSFHDEVHPTYGTPFGTYLIQSDYQGSNAYGQTWRNCSVVATNHISTFIRTSQARGFTFENSTVRQVFTPGVANTPIGTFSNVVVRNTSFYNGMTAPPAGLHIDGGGGAAGLAEGQVFVDSNISWGFATGITNTYVPQTFQSGFKSAPVTFANLISTFGDGTQFYCSNCTVATPGSCTNVSTVAACTCVGTGSGAYARRTNGVWLCN